MLHATKTLFALAAALTTMPAFASDTASSRQGWINVTPSISEMTSTSALRASPIDLGRLAALKANSDGTRFSNAQNTAKSWQVIVPAKSNTIMIDPAPDSEFHTVPNDTPTLIILDDSASAPKISKRPKIVPGVYRTVEFRK